MSSLTDISISARKVVIWVVVMIVAYVLLRLLWSIASTPKDIPVTVTIAAPDYKFGKLPVPQFEHISTSSSGLQFILQNVEGKPPETTPSARVYRMPKKLPSILGTQNAKSFAANLGFVHEPEVVNATHFTFFEGDNHEKSLEIDSVNMNYSYHYNYRNHPEIFQHKQILSSNFILEEIKRISRRNNLIDESLLSGPSTIKLLSFDPASGELQSVKNFSKADSARIDFFRTVDNTKILPPLYDESFNHILYAPSAGFFGIIELNNVFWPIAYSDVGIYALKSSDQAWSDLLDGYAYVVRMGENTADKPIIIRNIYLAYYESEQPQNYLQPIFVFEGDKSFVAYTVAIPNEWFE